MILGLGLGVLAAASGAHWAAVAVAPAAFGTAWLVERRGWRRVTIASWLLAPVAALAVIEVPSVVDVRAPLLLPAAVLAWWPLLRSLGGGTPWLVASLFALLPAAAVLVAYLTPIGPALVSADIATRTQVLYMAAATVIGLAVLRALPSRRAVPP